MAVPSMSMNISGRSDCARATQIAEATAPVRGFSPCHTPPVGGRRGRRAVSYFTY